jgi:hypothetical protein
MGAIERQVTQVKRKNSTSCRPPDARLTVVGSVASRFGPREVARGYAVGAMAPVAAGVTPPEILELPVSEAAGGAQAARRTAIKLITSRIEGSRLGKLRILFICLLVHMN